MSFSLDAIGPLARTVRDCARLLQVIAGADPRDATSSDAAVPDYEAALERGVRGLRIGVATSYFNEGVTPEVRETLERSLKVLESLGAHIVPLAVPRSVADIGELHPLVMKAEGAASHENWMRERADDYSDQVRKRLQAGFFIPATDYIQALKVRGQLLEEFMSAVFRQVDVLHTPVLPMPVPTIAETMPSNGQAYLDMVASLTRNTKVVNYLGLPALSVPCGFVGRDLPVSFQLIGRPLDEPTLLRVGHAYQSATDWHQRLPSVVQEALHE
jgi:aspartyl-tRNA(Asn)/glutamyl-tRNA(Gln) amidotransferase subunit A